jgi:hypothetical protein
MLGGDESLVEAPLNIASEASSERRVFGNTSCGLVANEGAPSAGDRRNVIIYGEEREKLVGREQEKGNTTMSSARCATLGCTRHTRSWAVESACQHNSSAPSPAASKSYRDGWLQSWKPFEAPCSHLSPMMHHATRLLMTCSIHNDAVRDFALHRHPASTEALLAPHWRRR